MKDIIIVAITLIIAAVFSTGGLYLADQRDQKLNAYADCVYHEARAEGFKGTDREAWDLFAEVCNQK